MAIWKDEEGRVITVNECIDALHSARSIMLKEMKSNRRIAEDLTIKAVFDRNYYILGKILDAYRQAIRKTVTPKTGKKRKNH